MEYHSNYHFILVIASVLVAIDVIVIVNYFNLLHFMNFMCNKVSFVFFIRRTGVPLVLFQWIDDMDDNYDQHSGIFFASHSDFQLSLVHRRWPIQKLHCLGITFFLSTTITEVKITEFISHADKMCTYYMLIINS